MKKADRITTLAVINDYNLETLINMRKIVILFLIFIYSCGTKDCKEWYSYIYVNSVTLKKTNHERIGDWYKTDFCNNELNLLVVYIYSADGYEECKSKIMIHSIVFDSTLIYCSSDLIIGSENVKINDNLLKYFKQIDYKGYTVFKYDTSQYRFPSFKDSTNMFKIFIKFTDNQVLSDSCIIKFE